MNIPRWLSLSEWSAKLLRLPKAVGTETEPGLVLIQIDGFSGNALKDALDRHEMPFLKGLLQKENYQLYAQYPGLPSSTPSVQGELFYGIKQIVPAFNFLDRQSGKVFRMYDGESALQIEGRLAAQGEGLLRGGSSYSNIFTGGAQESHFCASSLGWNQIWKDANPLNFVVLSFTHLPSVLRMLVLTAYEFILGIIDFGWGIFHGENLKKEWRFIYLRALLCVLLRELVMIGVKIDITRGLPVIHMNFLGYDEHAHNRGPSSLSAHWTLKGIDRAIEKIYRKALHSPRRSYDVWVYSDHGQEDTVSYEKTYNRNVQEAVAEVFKEFDPTADLFPFDNNGLQLQRARFFGISLKEEIFSQLSSFQDHSLEKKLVVTCMGPTGNIYLPQKMNKGQMGSFARGLVDKAKIPVIMMPEERGQVRVWTQEGEFILPQDAQKILGEDHPFLSQVTEDLITVCHHPSAGDLTFMGFRPGAKPMNFPLEKGNHGGPGPQETNGFALLPDDIISTDRERTYVTPMDLRVSALKFLKRRSENSIPGKTKDVLDTIRIMTYNVRSCLGMDGKISPQRIARVIGRHKPDIVALQELDMGRKRSGEADQAHLIARELEMIYHFHPSIVVDEERYGDAVLSRFPMELIRAGQLPGNINQLMGEPRGAIWTSIDTGGTKINFLNTHLGLFPRERKDQTKALLGSEWLTHPSCREPVILCGDFNALPNSQVCRDIKKVLRDAQEELDDHSPKATWFSHYPVGRIDHIFVSPGIEVARVKVSMTDLDKIASDHLPLIVDIKIKPAGPL
jgi:endonuclease/exonuclease/phosphatase family metal-dependent hydrolase